MIGITTHELVREVKHDTSSIKKKLDKSIGLKDFIYLSSFHGNEQMNAENGRNCGDMLRVLLGFIEKVNVVCLFLFFSAAKVAPTI